MARKKWSKLTKEQKKAFKQGDRSVGKKDKLTKKDYQIRRQSQRPVSVNKAASEKVQNVADKLKRAQKAGKDKQARKLVGKLNEVRGNQIRSKDVRKMLEESGGNIRKVNRQLKQKNLRAGAQKFLNKKLAARTNKPPTEITRPIEPETPTVIIKGGAGEVKNETNITNGTGTAPNELPSQPNVTAAEIGNQATINSTQTVGYDGTNEITNSLVMGGVGNVDNSNNSSFFQGSQAFQQPETPDLPEAESGSTTTPVSNVLETNKTQEVDYNGQNTISNSFIGGGVGNVNNADYSVTIQGGGEGGSLSNMGAAAAANALNENQYERSQSKVTGSSIANKYIANMLGGSGIMDTINNANNRANQAQAYWGARANQQRDFTIGNRFKPVKWRQPKPLEAVENKVEDIFEDIKI